MASISTISVPDLVTFLTISGSSAAGVEKDIQLPTITTANSQRVVLLKEATGGLSNYFVAFATAPNQVNYVSSISINTLGCIQLQANGNNWDLLDSYSGFLALSNVVASPSAISVYPSTNVSYLNVDLTSQSKNVVLQGPATLLNRSNSSLFYSIKDVNGYAATNPLYITPAGGTFIDTTTQSIQLSTNYVCVQLFGDVPQNKWHIVNYYSGP